VRLSAPIAYVPAMRGVTVFHLSARMLLASKLMAGRIAVA
jgi:hypothetical protein